MEKKYLSNTKNVQRNLDGTPTGDAPNNPPDDLAFSFEPEQGGCAFSFQDVVEGGRVCGIWGWYNKKTGEVRRFFCGKRNCKRTECRRIFHWRRVRLVASLCEEYGLKYFFTLTIDPKNIEAREDDPWRHIHNSWRKFRTIVQRKYSKVKYVAVLEKHKNNDRPHIHGFWNMFLPWEWMQERWKKCHGGNGYYVEEVRTNQNVADYVGKQLEVHRYIGKDCVTGVPERVKRTLWRSQHMKAAFELTSSGEWCIMKDKVFNEEGNKVLSVVPGKESEDGKDME